MCQIASCDQGYADCDHLEPTGCEQNIETSADNCGACGQRCKLPNAGASCAAGQCTVASCVAGYADCNGVAADGCEVNELTDVNNCGACGNACTPAPNAVARCAAGGDSGVASCNGFAGCQSGYADCDGSPSDGCEVDTLTDVNNCGGCGSACSPLDNATVGCAGGACDVAACDQGFGDCDQSVFDGCESNLASDANNCSACGQACAPTANGEPACVDSACVVGSCDSGYADCDGDPTNGCEANLSDDAVNCGACGVVCAAVANGTPGCSEFACGIGSCDPGFANCSGGVATGCATDLQTDVNNCGNCGAACSPVANGTRACDAATCGIGACDTGYGDCDGLLGDGCEAPLATDVNDCGSCGHVCPTPANGVAGCAAGSCTLASCDAGFANCDGNAANGCETSTSSDPANCGGCGVLCGSGQCANSTCADCVKNVLLLEDDSSSETAVLAAAITAAGYAVTQSTVPSYQYTGANPALTGYGAVIVLAGGPAATSYTTDMPLAGQQAIVSFLKAGNGVVFTEWAAYQVANGRWATLAPYVLLQRTEAFEGQVTYTVDSSFASSPLWSGLPASFTFASSSNVGVTKVAAGVTRIAGSPQAVDAVAIMDTGVGRVVHVAHAGNYAPNGWTNSNMQTLMANAVGWVARCD